MDTVAGEAGPPITAKNDGTALRAYYHMINQNSLNQNEYRLFCVGSFDNEKMTISPGIREIIENKDEGI